MNSQHPRTHKVALAKLEIQRAVYLIIDSEGLTFVESMQALADTQQGLAKEALRKERHPNSPDTPADLES